MNPVKVMINGLPGNVAGNIARQILADRRFRLLPWSLTGPDIAEATFAVDTFSVQLLTPEKRDAEIEKIKQTEGDFITVDFTLPAAVNDNADFYCRHT
ncbi:MAG: dihydrodipicolinate reductase, partial [Desulfobacterales bacterium]